MAEANFHNAKGTPEKDYLDPVLFENVCNEVYTDVNDISGKASARTDAIKMNREHMDYTLNGIRQMLMKIAKAFDLNGDGYVGLDDSDIILQHYALVQTGVPENEVFYTIFTEEKDINDYTLNAINFINSRKDPPFAPLYPNRLEEIAAQDGNTSFYCDTWYTDQLGDVNYWLPLFKTDYNNLNYNGCKAVYDEKIQILNANFVHPVDASSAGDVLYLILNKEDRAYGACLTLEEFVDVLLTEFNGVNLLMPQYARRVEVEDLDENFWVIGQALTFLMNGDFRVSSQIEEIRKQLRTKRDSIIVPEEDYEASYNNLFDSDKEYIYIGNTIKSIHFEELKPTVGQLPSDYWAMFIIERSSQTTTIEDLLLNSSDTDAPIKLINPDLDISGYNILNILFFYNGDSVCAIVNGY